MTHPGFTQIAPRVFVATASASPAPAARRTVTAAQPAPGSAEAFLAAHSAARAAAITPSADASARAQAAARERLTANGAPPRTDPGAGLSPARASMARILAESGQKPAA